MRAVAVRRLQEEDVKPGRDLRIAQNCRARPSQIAGEAERLPVGVDHGDRGAEDVPRVVEGDPGRPKPERLVVRHGVKTSDRPRDVLRDVERRDRRQARAGAERVDVAGVLMLDLGAVLEHELGEITGRPRAVDRAAEAAAHEGRQVAAVVQVGVGEHHGVDARRVEREAAVDAGGLLAASLEQSAVEEEARPARLDQVHRAGDGAHRAGEGDPHDQ
ncbi:MAG TPA: hypothetical protein VGX97_10490 [bacterium]|nr:hypothetical protein [bacterium]